MVLSSRRFKDTIYEQLARIGKAIASPRRLELLELLDQGPQTVATLAKLSGQSMANTSAHLQVLKNARLVSTQQNGLFVTYQLDSPDVSGFMLNLRNLAENHLAEIEKVTREFLAERGGFKAVDHDTLLARMESGEITLIDVRPPGEFASGHIPGAISIPLEELEERLAEVPSDQEIVAYCRGPYCVMAIEAVTILRNHGRTASRLEDGVPDWRAMGLDVTTGEASQ